MKLVPYYRCSTQKQARSGLGLEGQETTVRQFASAHGAQVLKSYIEVETGKWAERPELAKAISHARRSKATLVIAKLDRLARNVHFLSGLMETGVKFVACDQPSANDLTIHILAAVAQDEAKRISERTKAALAAYKARGGILGASRPECRNLSADASKRGAAAAGESARRDAALESANDTVMSRREIRHATDISDLAIPQQLSRSRDSSRTRCRS